MASIWTRIEIVFGRCIAVLYEMCRGRGRVLNWNDTACIGPLAQRLEQGTHNPLVVGSNPTGPTNETKQL